MALEAENAVTICSLPAYLMARSLSEINVRTWSRLFVNYGQRRMVKNSPAEKELFFKLKMANTRGLSAGGRDEKRCLNHGVD